MSKLMIKKLAALQPGTRVAIKYEGSPELTGVVLDTDGEESFELELEDGGSLIVDFQIVTSCRVLTDSENAGLPKTKAETETASTPAAQESERKDAGKAPQGVDKQGQPYPQPQGYPYPSPQPYAQPWPAYPGQIPPAYQGMPGYAQGQPVYPGMPDSSYYQGQPVYPGMPAPSYYQGQPIFQGAIARPSYYRDSVAMPTYSQEELQALFQELSKEERKGLNGYFESFKFGMKNNDAEKKNIAAVNIRKEVEKNGLTNPAMTGFAGAVLLLVNRHKEAGDMLSMAGKMPEAAAVYYQEKDYAKAGACAYRALLQELSREDREKCLLILDQSCVFSKDVSLLRDLPEKLPVGNRDILDSMYQHLAAQGQIRLNRPQGYSSDFLQLQQVYPEKKMEEALAEVENRLGQITKKEPLLNEKNDGQGALVNGAAAPEDKPVMKPEENLQKIGWVESVSWMSRKGKIMDLDDNAYPFQYDSAESRLQKKLACITKEELKAEMIAVNFTVGKKGEALSIRQVGDMGNMAHQILKSNSSAEVFPLVIKYLEHAPGQKMSSECLNLVLKRAVSYLKESDLDGELQIAIRTKELFLKNTDQIQRTLMGYDTVVQFFAQLKDYKRAVNYMKGALALPDLSTESKIERHMQFINLLKEMNEEEGETVESLGWICEECDKLGEYYALLDESSSSREVFQVLCLINRFLIKAEAELKLGRPEEAREDFKKVKGQTVSGSMRQLYDRLESEFARMAAMEAFQSKTAEGGYEEEKTAAGDTLAENDGLQELKPQERELQNKELKDQEEPEKQNLPAVSLREEDAEVTRNNRQADRSFAMEYAGEQREDIEREYSFLLQDYSYEDLDASSCPRTEKKDIIDYALSVEKEGRIAVLLAYLKAGSMYNPDVLPVYKVAGLALNNPLESQDYSAGNLMGLLGEMDQEYAVFSDYCLTAAAVRAVYSGRDAFSFNITPFLDSLQALRRFPAVLKALEIMMDFHQEYKVPMERMAACHHLDEKAQKERMETVIAQATMYYEQFIQTPPRGDANLKRLSITKKIIFDPQGKLGVLLRYAAERNFAQLDDLKEEFRETWLSGGEFLEENISVQAIDDFIFDCWDQADARHHSTRLQGQRMNNLRSNLRKILEAICECYHLLEYRENEESREREEYYRIQMPNLLAFLEEAMAACEEETEIMKDDPEHRMGLYILKLTLKSVKRKVDGSWDENLARMCFADFLKTDFILLREDFLPDLESRFSALPDFNVLARIRAHAEEPEVSFEERIRQIYSRDPGRHNFGTARLIGQYLTAMKLPVPALPDYAEQCVSQAMNVSRQKLNDFRRAYALGIAQGQIPQSSAFLENAESMVLYWYDACSELQNYGFVCQLEQHILSYIHVLASKKELLLKEQLSQLIANNETAFQEYPEAEERLRALIEEQNFTVAEDEMNHLLRGEFMPDLEKPEALTYLQEFWEEFAADFKQVSDLSVSLQTLLVDRMRRNKEQKGAANLVESWPRSGGPSSEGKVTQLLTYLGWNNISVTRKYLPGDNTEVYKITRDQAVKGRFFPQHNIAAFSSMISRTGFLVVCLYGAYDSVSLLEKFKRMEGVEEKAILVVVDAALTAPERRSLARKMKQIVLHHTFLVLDRVGICYLHNHYQGSVMNRKLMAIGMPFSWLQPYVAESGNYMPPEMFIGREKELRLIEESSFAQPDSVNLIYGGRQLGKTRLLKKAVSDVEKIGGQRAVIVDLVQADIAASASRISRKLADKEILPAEAVTDSWDSLIGSIRRRLKAGEEETFLSEQASAIAEGETAPREKFGERIPYLLLLLDEADAFINDCERFNYQPITELKILQEEMPQRFKFVIAGLHDVVRFNRKSALGNNAGLIHLKGIPIRPFTKQEATRLLMEPLSYLGFSIDDATQASQIVATANYFPGLIQLYCQKLVESLQNADYGGFSEADTPPYHISNDLIGRVLADNNFIREIRKKFESTLMLENHYYLIALLLSHMMYEQEEQKGYTAEDILEEAKKLGIEALSRLDMEQMQAFLQELYDLNVLRHTAKDTYQFSSDNYRGLMGTEQEVFDRLIEYGGNER